MVIFNSIDFSNPRTQYIFPFVLTSMSLISVLQFLDYKLFASWGRFIPRYFIVFDAVLNRIVSLISVFDNLLLVCRNTKDCILYVNIWQLYRIHWWVLVVFWWHLYDFLSILSSYLQTLTVLVLPSHLDSFIFLFWVLWLGLSKLYWIKAVKVCILMLFLVLEGMLWTFHRWVWC